MPLYEFRCKKCNYKFEELVSSTTSDFKGIVCPQCGEKAAEKLMSTFCAGSQGSSASSATASCGRSGFS